MNTKRFQNLVMGNLFHTQEGTPIPKEYYIGLATSAPTVEGVCSGEPTTEGTGYKRVKLEHLSEPTDGVIKNTMPITFPESISSWGTITHYAVFDAQSGGNLLFFGNLSLSRNVEQNTLITIKANELKLSLEPPAAAG